MPASVWETGAEIISVNANTTLVNQLFTATNAQSLFTLTAFEYVLGTGSLLVFKNGDILAPGTDYTETSTSSFTLTTPAALNDKVLALGFVGIEGSVGTLSGSLYSVAEAYTSGTLGYHAKKFVDITDSPYNVPVDGVTDGSAALQVMFDDLKGANATAAGRKLFHIHIPNIEGAFLKLSETTVIDGTNGYMITGDGGQTKRSISASECGIRWYGAAQDPIFQLKGGTGTPSNPNLYACIEHLTISGYPTDLVPGNPIPANIALSAIHLGTTLGENDNTINRGVIIRNCNIFNCRFGIWSGNPDGFNTDHTAVEISNCFIYNNAQAGIHWGDGNAIGTMRACTIFGNGWGSATYPADDYMPQIGANVYIGSGQLDIYAYTSAGSGANKPTDADIYQGQGRVSVYGAWSDTHGYFFFQEGGGSTISKGTLLGVRHYEGSMTTVNTRNSVRITNPGMSLTSCSFFGHVRLDSGLGGCPVISGISFLEATSTYVGTGVDTQRSLLVLGNYSNFAQILFGGATAGVPLLHTGSFVPHLLMMGLGTIYGTMIGQFRGAAATDPPCNMTYNPGDGSVTFWSNCTLSATGATPVNVNEVMVETVIGGLPGLAVYTADPNGSAAEIIFANFVLGPSLVYHPTGGHRTEMAWKIPNRAADPTASVALAGSIYYNTVSHKVRFTDDGITWSDV
jgi:hypothetical protein